MTQVTAKQTEWVNDLAQGKNSRALNQAIQMMQSLRDDLENSE